MKPEKKYGTGYSKVLLTWEQDGAAKADEKWVCHNCGRIFPQEDFARDCCVKSKPCKTEGCNNRTSREYYSQCNVCLATEDRKRWTLKPEREYQGEPLTLQNDDKCFWSEDDLLEYCEVEQVQPENLMLVFLEEQKPRYLDLMDFWYDDLPEDYDDAPVGLQEMETAVNDWWAKNGPKVYRAAKERPTASSLPHICFDLNMKADYEEQINASEG